MATAASILGVRELLRVARAVTGEGRGLKAHTHTHTHPQAAEVTPGKVRGKDSRARGVLANQLCISGYLPLMHAWKDEQTGNSMLSQWHSPMQSLRLLTELQKEGTHRPVKYDLTLP